MRNPTIWPVVVSWAFAGLAFIMFLRFLFDCLFFAMEC